MSFTGRLGHKKSKAVRSPPYSIESSSISAQFSPKSSYDRSTYQFQQQLPPQQSMSHKYNIHFSEYSPNLQQASHTQVIVHGSFHDLNAVISELINHRQPATPIMHSRQSVSFTCPLSGIPITCPGRGAQCNHPGCFDLRQFLVFASGEVIPCPICKEMIGFDDLRFDPSFFQCDTENNQNPNFFQVPEDDQWVADIFN